MSRDIKVCNCKKSNCLKLYCDCFANGSYCNPGKCNCFTCFNNVQNEDKRSRAMISTIGRDSSAFRPKVISKEIENEVEKSHKKGCNCKKSNCLKKYCECYSGNITCSDKCKCIECLNIVGVSSRGQSSLFSLATAGQMMSSADYHRPERSSSIGSTVEESESSEGTFPQSNKLPPIHRPASSSSSSSVQQFVNFKNNYTNLSNLTNRVVARPSIADTEECPLLPISMIKRVCESMLENISKKIRVVEDSTQNGSESYVFVDSESGQAVSMTRAVISTFCDTIKQELSDPDAIEACSCDAISSESKLSFNNYSGSNLPYPAQMSSTYGFYGGFGSQSDSRDLYLNSMGLQQPDQQDSLLAGAEYSKPITLSQVSNDERTMGGSVTSEDFFQYGLSQSLSQSQSYARTGAESCVIDLTSQSPPSFAPSSSSSSQSSSDGKSTSEPENSSEELSTVEKESMRDSTGDSVEDSARDSARSMLAHSPTTFATDSADETAGTKDTLKSKFPPSSSIQFGEGTHVMPI